MRPSRRRQPGRARPHISARRRITEWAPGMTDDKPAIGSHQDFVILQTEDWTINHRVDSALPGYLILATRMPTNELCLLNPRALAELGKLLAKAQLALNAILNPEHLYIGQYGHMAGHALHFHIIPVCGWVKQSFFRDPRYRALQALSERPGVDETDGAELTLFIWREFCERRDPPAISGPSVDEVVDRLKILMAGAETP
jgi:diadenosine tetraphosphate (Ap4A) HIT family hydrolase